MSTSPFRSAAVAVVLVSSVYALVDERAGRSPRHNVLTPGLYANVHLGLGWMRDCVATELDIGTEARVSVENQERRMEKDGRTFC